MNYKELTELTFNLLYKFNVIFGYSISSNRLNFNNQHNQIVASFQNICKDSEGEIPTNFIHLEININEKYVTVSTMTTTKSNSEEISNLYGSLKNKECTISNILYLIFSQFIEHIILQNQDV